MFDRISLPGAPPPPPPPFSLGRLLNEGGKKNKEEEETQEASSPGAENWVNWRNCRFGDEEGEEDRSSPSWHTSVEERGEREALMTWKSKRLQWKEGRCNEGDVMQAPS